MELSELHAELSKDRKYRWWYRWYTLKCFFERLYYRFRYPHTPEGE